MSEKEKECMSKGRSILHFFLPKFDILKIIRIIGSFISFCSLPWEFSGYLREKIMRKRLNCFRLTQVFSRMITFIVIGICMYIFLFNFDSYCLGAETIPFCISDTFTFEEKKIATRKNT